MSGEKVFNLTLKEVDVNVILASLGEMPAKQTWMTIVDIKAQCQRQTEMMPKPKKEESKK